MQQIKEFFGDKEEPKIIDFLQILAILAFCFLVFYYGDISITQEHTFNFLDSIFSGKLRDFYQIAIENSQFGQPAVYDILIYAIFAIWNLPLYIVSKITGYQFIQSGYSIIWLKLFLILFVLLTLYEIYHIALDLKFTKGTAKWICFVTITSGMFVVPVFIQLQYDIISVFFTLCGVRALINGKRKKFILFFAIANALKLFSLFVFIPLILLKEKRVLVAIKEIVLGCLLLVAGKILYIGNVAYQSSTSSFSDMALERIQALSIPGAYSEIVIPFFMVILIGSVIFAYVYNSDNENYPYMIIYIPMVIYMAFVICVDLNPYWIILVAPFVAIGIFLNPPFVKVGVYLEMAISFSITFILWIRAYWTYSLGIMNRLILPKLFPNGINSKYFCIKDVIYDYGIYKYIGVIEALLVACAIGVCILCYPRKNDMELKVNRGVMWTRHLVPFIIIAALCFVYFHTNDNMLWDETYSSDNVAYSANVQENKVTETLVFVEKKQLTKMEIDVSAENFTWMENTIVNIAISNGDGTEIYSKNIAANCIENNVITCDLDRIVINADEKYQLTISAYNSEALPVYVLINNNTNVFKTFDGSKVVNGDISLRLYGNNVE